MDDKKQIAKDYHEDAPVPAIVDEGTIRDKIYVIRGQQVMLDSDLAAIYGYTTSAFNQQVKRNADRFPADFRFQLSKEDLEALSRSQNVILNRGTGRGANIKYMPYAYNEQGIYMLMTVLKGELAVQQSIALIRTFKAMKDYIVDSRVLVSQTDQLRLSMQMTDMKQDIQEIRTQLDEHTRQLTGIMAQMDDTVRKSDLPKEFLDPVEARKQYLIFGGQPAMADETYIRFYALAKHTIHIIDDYINIKTLRLLQDADPGVAVTVFSDNVGNKLHASDVADFKTEFPHITVSFKSTNRLVHDRFFALDYGTPDERIFHCGASSKDAGVQKATAITEFTEKAVKDLFQIAMAQLSANPPLVLR